MSAVARAAGDRSAEDAAVRRRVLEAAVDCIIESGVYRSSTEAIARTAGVTAAVIEEEFGDRDQLMLAVLNDGMARLQTYLAGAKVAGETVEERLETLASIIAGFYHDRRYLAFVQIQLDLTHDPATARLVERAFEDLQRAIDPVVGALVDDVFEEAVPPAPEFRALFFFAVRGLALASALHAVTPGSGVTHAAPDFDAELRLLVHGLSQVYRDQGVRRVHGRR